MKFPKIKIFYNRLIDPFFIGYNKQYSKGGWDKWTAPTKEKVLQKTKELREEWKQYEKEILTAVYKITELEFKRNIIDVHIVSGSPRNMSKPLIISAHEPTENFVNTMTHELIHKLFSDNIHGKVYRNIFIDMFPKETTTTQSHVIVHAILKYIYLDVLKDENKLKENLIKSKKHSTNDYARAWEIVKKEGYLNLIEKFKKITRSHV